MVSGIGSNVGYNVRLILFILCYHYRDVTEPDNHTDHLESW